MTEMVEDIRRLKKRLDAVILAHNYQVEEVQAIADHIGDSLELSRIAASAPQRMIVFCGVKFMAETAKILSPAKTVLLPRLDAGCPMADMITVAELRSLRERHPDAAVVAYVNSSAEIKAESDVCCTSANAVAVVRQVPARRVIFVPDQNLGAYVQRRVPEKELILYEGFCFVHSRIRVNDIEATKREHPQAVVVVHPEVPPAVQEIADEILSTSGMLRFARSSDKLEFIVATEQGLLERLKQENPGKAFYPAGMARICVNMKRTELADVHRALKEKKYEVRVPEAIREKAVRALNGMLKYQ